MSLVICFSLRTTSSTCVTHIFHFNLILSTQDFPVYKVPYIRSSTYYSRQDRENNNLRRNLLTIQEEENQQVGIDLIQAPLVWSALKDTTQYNHTAIKVCIIDTGYDFGHEDLPTNEVTGTETIYGSALTDGDGHGTHCAGVIGAVGWNQKGVVGGKYIA